MPQVSMNIIDIATTSDSTGYSVKSVDVEQSDSIIFSQVMEKHQSSKSGKESHACGKCNTDNPHDDNKKIKFDDKSTSITPDKDTFEEESKVEETDLERMNQSPHESHLLNQTPVNVESKIGELDNKILYSQNKENHVNEHSSENSDMTDKLLSFILASDEVSVERSNQKNQLNDLIASDSNKLTNIPTDLKQGLMTKQSETVHAKSAPREIVLTKNGNSKSIVPESIEIEKNEKKSVNNQINIESSKPLLTATNRLEKTLLESEAKHVQPNAITEPELPISELSKTAESIKQAISVGHASTTIDEKNKNIDAVSRETNLPKEELRLKADASIDLKVAITPSKNVDEVNNPLGIKVESDKNEATKNQQAEKGIARESVVMKGEFQSASEHSDRQQHDKNKGREFHIQSSQNSTDVLKREGAEKTVIESVDMTKEMMIKEGKINVTDKPVALNTTKIAHQTHFNEIENTRVLAQQSQQFSEEQFTQNTLMNAKADSISVQSTKAALHIHNETIAIHRKTFTNEVKEKVMVMINQRIKQLEIRLDPPELGSMQVKLNLQNEQAVVNFVVQNQQAKEALEENLGKLKDMLAQNGVEVGDANIEQRKNQSQDGDSAQGSNKNATENDEKQAVDSGMQDVNLYKASSTGVDYYA